MTYSMTVAGLQRELPICKVADDLYIGAFICFGDAELTVACARDLLKLVENEEYDYLFTAEAKSIPLIHEMARQSGAKKYFIARKGPKAYMPDPWKPVRQALRCSPGSSREEMHGRVILRYGETSAQLLLRSWVVPRKFYAFRPKLFGRKGFFRPKNLIRYGGGPT